MTYFSRRGFLSGVIAACAAPAIVRAGVIMPIKWLVPFTTDNFAVSVTSNLPEMRWFRNTIENVANASMCGWRLSQLSFSTEMSGLILMTRESRLA